MAKPPFTADELRAELRYDPLTGEWTRLIARSNKVKVGDKAGSKDSHGYLNVRVWGRLYIASRLAWYYMTGEWPEVFVDHEDTDHSNDRWSNLRLATRSQNEQNKRARRMSKTQIKNVTKYSWGYRVRITKNGVRVNVGNAKTLDEARQLALQAAADAHGEFARV